MFSRFLAISAAAALAFGVTVAVADHNSKNGAGTARRIRDGPRRGKSDGRGTEQQPGGGTAESSPGYSSQRRFML